MTTEIVKYKDTLSGAEVALSLIEIKRLFCPKATDQEASLFLELCRYQGLNPFVRDAYLLKFGDRPATMVVGKDSFTKRAEAHPQFAGMVAGVIIQAPDISGVEYRKGSLILDNEKLVGGWAEIHRLDRKIPTEIPVSFREYDTGQAGWKSMPGTMIRKVALVQALREAFPNTFAGLYDATEMKVDLPDEDASGAAMMNTAPIGPTCSGSIPPTVANDLQAPSVEPPAVPSADVAPFCPEHQVPFQEKRSTRTGVSGWVHKKIDGAWCVWDRSTQAEAADVLVVADDKTAPEPAQNTLEEINSEPIK
jgi:phage recombination protein Bet